MPLLKPGHWAVNLADIDPRYLGLWRGLQIVMPFFDASGISWHEGQWITPTVTGPPVLQPAPQGVGVKFDETNDYYGFAGPDVDKSWDAATADDFAVLLVLRTGTVAGAGFQYIVSAGTVQDPLSLNIYIAEDDWPDRFNAALNNAIVQVSPPAGLAADTDYRFLVQRRSGRLQIWVDGIFLGDDASSNDSIDVTTSGVEIGRRADANVDRYFGGLLYATYKWNRSLSESEICLLEIDPFGLIRPALFETVEVEEEGTISPAAVTVVITPGTVAVVPGEVPVDLAAATVAVTPGTVTVAPGAVAIAPEAVTVTVTPGTVTVTQEDVPIPLAQAVVSVTPGTVEVASGAANISLAAATVTVTGGFVVLSEPGVDISKNLMMMGVGI